MAWPTPTRLTPSTVGQNRCPSRHWRPVVWLIIGSGLAEIAFWAFAPGRFLGWPSARNPFGVDALRPFLDPYANYAQTPLLVLTVLLPAISLLMRFWRSRGVERQQIKWFVSAGALVAFAATLLFVVGVRSSDLIEGVLWGFFFLAPCTLPASMGMAILRYRLWDIDLVINRALVYGALTAGVVGIYVLVVGVLGVLCRVQCNILVSILAAGLVAVLFQPLRYRLQRGVNRPMYGERDDPYAVLSRLGRRLDAAIAPDEVLPAIVETVTSALKLPYAAITLKREEGFETAVERPWTSRSSCHYITGRRRSASFFSATGRLTRLSRSRTCGCSKTLPYRLASPPTPCV